MYIGYSEEQEQLRRELRAYYDKLLTPEVEEGLARGHGIGPVNREVVRQMGEDGWLGIGWPKEYGGQGRSAIEQFIFFDESMRAGAPVPMLTINTVGPTIMDFGTDEQKAEFLPKILKGEIHFCIGYTEPGAGTDLAALTTKAVRDGDEYVINGQKMFTSLAGDADYCWLAVRTDPEAKKHKGISMFVVPMDTPGIKLMPMDLMSDHDINQVFYDDVRVPAIGARRRREQRLGPDHEPAEPRARHAVLVRDHRARAHRHTPVGAGDQARRRPARHRPGVGAGAPGPRPRPARVPAPRQLEGGVGRDAEAPRRRRRVDDQGVRHRVLPRGVPPDVRGDRSARVSQAGRRPTRC